MGLERVLGAVDPIGDAQWTDERRALWGRIAAHRFEMPEQGLDFARRLARDHGWTLAFARGAIEEYRRFCFLAVAVAPSVTPSEEVDEVWHLHLVHSRDYWESWCATVLCRTLHHGPTRGGADEGSRYRAQYARTMAWYEDFFGPPPVPFWPATHLRFRAGPRFRTVDGDALMVLPRPRALARRAMTLLMSVAQTRRSGRTQEVSR